MTKQRTAMRFGVIRAWRCNFNFSMGFFVPADDCLLDFFYYCNYHPTPALSFSSLAVPFFRQAEINSDANGWTKSLNL